MQENSKPPLTQGRFWKEKRRWLMGQKKGSGQQEHNNDLIKDFIFGHCAGVGEELDPTLVRAAMAARANVPAAGYSGARPVAVQKILEMLNQNIIPKVPSQAVLVQLEIWHQWLILLVPFVVIRSRLI